MRPRFYAGTEAMSMPKTPGGRHNVPHSQLGWAALRNVHLGPQSIEIDHNRRYELCATDCRRRTRATSSSGQYVLRVLDRVRWNVSAAARFLGVHRNTIVGKLSAWASIVRVGMPIGWPPRKSRPGDRLVQVIPGFILK